MPEYNDCAFSLVVDNISSKAALSQSEINLFVANKMGELLSKKSINQLVAHFNGTYTSKTNLIELISYLAENWDSLDDNTKRAIALKISEGAAHCMPGFHNGLIEISKSIAKCESLAFYLQLIRENIVEKVAISLNCFDTHAHESVFLTARAKGLGVRANTNDAYARVALKGETADALDAAFARDYSLFTVFTSVQEHLKNSAREYYSYRGPLANEYYSLQEYSEWEGLLKRVFEGFNPNECGLESILLLDDEGAVCDLNWSFINNKLLRALVSSYINWPEARKKSFLTLVDTTDLNQRTTFMSEALTNEDVTGDALNFLLAVFKNDIDNAELSTPLLTWLSTQPDSFLLQATTHYPYLFQALSKVKPSPKATQVFFPMLSYRDKSQETVLMSVARYQPEAVTAIMEAVMKCTPEQLFTILNQKNSQGATTLMFAAQYQSEVATAIIEAAMKCTPEQVFTILNQKNSQGTTALMFAAHYQPEAVTAIIKAAMKCIPDQIFTLLSRINSRGETALMFAAYYQPEAVTAIIKAAMKGTPEQIFTLLSRINSRGETALMIAAQYQPEAVTAIIEGVMKCTPEQIFTILNQKYSQDSTALTLAAQYQPKAATAIIEATMKCTPEQIFTLVSQKDSHGKTALIIAAYYHHEAATAIMKAAMKCSPEQVFTLFIHKNSYGATTLMLAAQHQPEAFDKLVQIIAQQKIKKIRIVDISSALKCLNKESKNNLSPYTQLALYSFTIRSEFNVLNFFGYSKTDKHRAANALLDVLNGTADVAILDNFKGPLSQGRLHKLYKNIEPLLSEQNKGQSPMSGHNC